MMPVQTEAAIHTMKSIFDDEDTHACMPSLQLLMPLMPLIINCTPGLHLSIVSIILYNMYGALIRLFITGEVGNGMAQVQPVPNHAALLLQR